MATQGFTLFDTPIGHCGLCWGTDIVRGVALPSHNPRQTRDLLDTRFPDVAQCPPPEWVRHLIHRLVALLRGEAVTLTDVPLDTSGIGTFPQRVYAFTRTVPAGQTRTYGEVATALGASGAARAVGRALGANPFPIIVPCHRVLAADGGTGGFSAHGGRHLKHRMLEIEGAADPALFDF